MAKKKRQKSRAAQITADTRGERAVERWMDQAEQEEHPERVDFESRREQEQYVKKEDTRTQAEIRSQSRKTGIVVAIVVVVASLLLIGSKVFKG